MSISHKSSQLNFCPVKFDHLKWHTDSEIPKSIHILEYQSIIDHDCDEVIRSNLVQGKPFYIRNFGIPEALIENAYNETRKFFDCSEEIKTSMVHRDLPQILRGYSGYGTGAYENSLHNGKAINQYAKYAWGPSHNISPNDTFAKIFNNIIVHMIRISDDIVAAITSAFSLTHHPQYQNLFEGEDRVLHCQCYYPEKPMGEGRMIPHADASTVTLLHQLPSESQHVGLQAKIDSEYIGIPPIRGTLVVMTGESLNGFSSGRIKPVIHAVAGPRTNIEQSERSSMPFFANPRNVFDMGTPKDSTHKKFYNINKPTSFRNYADNIAQAYQESEKTRI